MMIDGQRPEADERAERTKGRRANGTANLPVPVGRPSMYTPELAEEICWQVAQGDKSLKAICEDPALPCIRSVYNWLNKHEDFATAYTKAKELQQEIIVDDTDALAVETWRRAKAGDASKEEVAALRELLHHRHWAAARLAPKKFSEQVQTQLNISGSIEIKANLEQALLRAAEHRRKLADQRGNVVDVEPDGCMDESGSAG